MRSRLRAHSVPLLIIALTVMPTCARRPSAPPPDMNAIAERYVKLVLEVGQHDPDLVDAYYGDERWRPTGPAVPLDALFTEAQTLWAALQKVPMPAGADDLTRLRRAYLARQISAIESRVAMLSGETYTFDNEAKLLYDARPPHKDTVEFAQTLAPLDKLLPGTGSLIDRYAAFRTHYVIPRDRLDAVFRAGIAACRARTLAHLTLPADEQFTVEYVTGKSWSAYNWYKGHYRSVIQVNTDLPITIDRVIDLACQKATRATTSTTCFSKRRSSGIAAGWNTRSIRSFRPSRSSRKARPISALRSPSRARAGPRLNATPCIRWPGSTRPPRRRSPWSSMSSTS
jgi:hypothetical protein